MLQKFLEPCRRGGATLTLVSLCVVLQVFRPVLLKNAVHKILDEEEVTRSFISTVTVSTCKAIIYHNQTYRSRNGVNLCCRQCQQAKFQPNRVNTKMYLPAHSVILASSKLQHLIKM